LSKSEGENYRSAFTPIAGSVVSELCKQVGGLSIDSCSSTPKETNSWIAVVEEFLAIFEKKPEYHGGPENPAGD
jgi:hypothetical protein